MIGLGLSLTKLAVLRSAGLRGLELFNEWFLASGTWDSDGKWIDAALWNAEWFLDSGVINVFGVWSDSEAW